MNKISQLNYNGTKVLAKYPMGVYNAIRKIPLGGIKRQNKEFVEILVIYARVCLSDCETPVAACPGWADPMAGFYADTSYPKSRIC